MSNKLVGVTEKDLGSTSDSMPDGLIKVEDSAMGFGMPGGELHMDEVAILFEFVVVMGEEEAGGFRGEIPGDCPIPVRLYFPRRFGMPKADFMLPNLAFILSDRDHVVEGAKDSVKVDGLSPEEILPLRGREPSWRGG